MLKKTMILAFAAMAGLAVSAPAASANWYKHHAVIQTDQQINFTGQFRFQNPFLGSIECQTHAKVKLIAGQTTANIEQFALDTTSPNEQRTSTQLCVTGWPYGHCSVTTFATTASTQKPWVAHLLGGSKDTIEITTGTIQYFLEGPQSTPGAHKACNVVQQFQFKPGVLHATVTGGGTCTVNQLTISGELETSLGSKITFYGIQNVIPGETYGTECP